jgi:MFS family permease
VSPSTLLSDKAHITAIVQAIGYKGTDIQLYSVPPYVCSAAFALASCYASDYFKVRGPFVILASCVSIVGYAMYLSSTRGNVLYASLFLQVIGTYTIAPLQSTWMSNNLSPFYKRVTGITMGFISTNSGGILSTWLFPTTEAPRFIRGTSVLLGLACVIVAASVANMLYLARENRVKRQRVGSEMVHPGEGDRNISYRYIL